MPSFLEWLDQRREDQDDFGILARDWFIKDTCRPRVLKAGVRSMIAHLKTHNADMDAIEVARKAWKVWRRGTERGARDERKR